MSTMAGDDRNTNKRRRLTPGKARPARSLFPNKYVTFRPIHPSAPRGGFLAAYVTFRPIHPSAPRGGFLAAYVTFRPIHPSAPRGGDFQPRMGGARRYRTTKRRTGWARERTERAHERDDTGGRQGRHRRRSRTRIWSAGSSRRAVAREPFCRPRRRSSGSAPTRWSTRNAGSKPASPSGSRPGHSDRLQVTAAGGEHSSNPALGGRAGGLRGRAMGWGSRDDISAGARPPAPPRRPSGHSPLPRRPRGCSRAWQGDGLQTQARGRVLSSGGAGDDGPATRPRPKG